MPDESCQQVLVDRRSRHSRAKVAYLSLRWTQRLLKGEKPTTDLLRIFKLFQLALDRGDLGFESAHFIGIIHLFFRAGQLHAELLQLGLENLDAFLGFGVHRFLVSPRFPAPQSAVGWAQSARR